MAAIEPRRMEATMSASLSDGRLLAGITILDLTHGRA